MRLTNRQRVGSLVAALAVAALGVDRFVLGGGGPATASAQAVLPTALPNQGESQPGVAVRTDSLADRLSDFAEAESLDPGATVPDLFGGAQSVQSVFGSGRRGGVRIGDKIIRVGGEWRGATLVRVARDGGYFDRDGHEFLVPLAKPGDDAN